MHNIFILALCLGFMLPASALAAPPTRIPAQATISAVTVYQDRAQVTRTVSASLKPGIQIIVVEGLPVLLQDDSIRVDAKGTARVIITGIEVKHNFLSQTADKRINEIDTELKQLERKLDSLDAKKAGLTAQKGFVDSIKVAWGERISQQLAIGKPTTGELNEAMGFVGSNTVKVEDQQREIEHEKQTIKAQMDALRRKKQEATSSYRKESKAVEVSVEATKEGKLTLDLSGVVNQATWKPGYDVRLSSDGSSAELTYRAQVRQQTGEDWNNVPLTLSTARPASGGAPPNLYPWQISFYRPMPEAMPVAAPMRSYKRAAKTAMAENMKTDMAMEEEEPEPAAFQTAQATTEGTTIVFKIPKAVDIPSDNTLHSTVIALERLPVNIEYNTVPKLSPTAYLTAELINKAAWPLLPGAVKIFSGNTFVGSAEMKQVASGEKFMLPFGSDDQITIKREALKQHKEAGLFGKNRMSYLSTVTITNFRKVTQTINLKDQLPLAGDNEIKVSLENATLPPTDKKADGTLIWKMKLAAGEKKVLSYDIVVEYPKDREVTGL